jgi:hypothetical protein
MRQHRVRMTRRDRIQQGTAHGSMGCHMRRHPRRRDGGQVGARSTAQCSSRSLVEFPDESDSHLVPGSGRSARLSVSRDRGGNDNGAGVEYKRTADMGSHPSVTQRALCDTWARVPPRFTFVTMVLGAGRRAQSLRGE